jgi:hypothetical protein
MQGLITSKLRNYTPVTELDRIIAFMISEPGTVELSDRETIRYKRIEFAYEHLQEYTDLELKNMLMNQFEVSKSTAYQDINDSYEIHGKTGKLRRDVELYFLLQDCKKTLRDAFASKNVGLMIKAIEAKAKVLALVPKEDQNDWEKYAPSNFYLVINQGTGGDVLKLDLTNAHKLPYTEFEELQSRLLESHLNETVEFLDKEDENEKSKDN